MPDFTDILKQFSGLDASLYGVAFVLAVGIRFGRASLRWMDSAHTLGSAILFGFVGAGLTLTQEPKHPWQFVVWQSLTLGVAVCVVEFALRKAADKIGWLPSDDQYLAPKPPDPPTRP
jgi:hypothetical protein